MTCDDNDIETFRFDRIISISNTDGTLHVVVVSHYEVEIKFNDVDLKGTRLLLTNIDSVKPAKSCPERIKAALNLGGTWPMNLSEAQA